MFDKKKQVELFMIGTVFRLETLRAVILEYTESKLKYFLKKV